MNNDTIRQFVRRELRAVTLGVATAIGIGGGLPAAIAGPIGGTVVSGQGSITSPNATTTLINQQSSSLTLNWSSFNIASGETVRFVQPSSSAVALNNILGQSPSQIFGQLDANGRVVLINPNGILFGRSAQLNVGSLIASSLDLKEYDPATGQLSFQSLSGHPGVIDNEGTITAAPGGSVALLGGTVLNNGLVVADYGTVAMAAGEVATLDFYGGGLLRVQVGGDLKTNPSGAPAAVQNSGRIEANGGQVLLTASATQDVFAAAVDNSGVIRAARIQNVGGVIELLGTDGSASNSGTLDASGAGPTSSGGTVTVTGSSVSMSGTARVDVSGAAGGGNAYIGGGLHGADSSIPNASSTSIAAGATIDADATHSGNGGTLAVWSDGATTAHGNLSANGGPAGGNGGLIETSGHILDVTGAIVRAAAPAGKAGQWLLDPTDVEIEHGSGSSIDGSGSNEAASPVYDSDINTALASGTNVTVETSTSPPTGSTSVGAITFGSGVVITNGGTSATTLTLDADTSIDLTNAATAPSITSGASPLSLVLNANVTGHASSLSLGSVTLDGTIEVSSLTVSGTGAIAEDAGTTVQVTGATVLGTTVGAGGDITLSNITNTFSGIVSVTGNDVTLANSVGTTLISGTSASSSLTLDAGGAVAFGTASTDRTAVTNGLVVQGLSGSGAAGGAVSQVGTLSVGTTSNIDAGGNAITLGNSGNSFGGNVTFTGAAVTLASGGALSSSGTASGNLSETAGGAISEGAAGIQLSGTAGTNTATFTVTGATYDVNLGSAANDFNGEATTITASGGGAVGNVSVADTNATFVPLTLPGTLTSLVLSDPNAPIGLAAQTLTGVGAGTNLAGGTTTLAVTAGGAITQSGALAVTGTTALNANAGTGTGAITLSNTSNAFNGSVTLTGGVVTLANSDATTLAGTNSASSLTLDSGDTVTFGAASTDSTTVTNGLIIQGLSGSGAAGGTVSQVGSVSVGTTTSIDAGTNPITLSNAANAFTGSVTLTAGQVTLANSDATTLAGTNSAGFLTLDAGGAVTFGAASTDSATVTNGLVIQGLSGSGAAGGPVSQVGSVSVGTTTSIDAGTSDITLSNAANTFTGPVTLTGGAVTLANTVPTTLVGANSAGNLTLDAGGGVIFGTAPTDSTTVTDGLVIQGLSGSGAAGADVNEVGGKLVVGTTTSIDAGTNDITLSNSANALSGSVTVTGGAVTLANSDATTLAGADSAGSLTLDAGGAVVFGTVSTDSTNVTNALVIQGLSGSGAAGGTVSQVGKLVVGATSSIDAGTNDITLSNSANALTGSITLAGGAVTLANANATTLAGADSASSLTLDAGGAVGFGTATTDSTTVTDGLVVQGVGGSGAAGGAVSQVGTLSVGTTSNIDAGGNEITLGNSGNSFGGNVTFTGTAVTLASAGALSSSGASSGNLSETAAGTISEGAAGIQLAGTAGTNTATFTVTGAAHDVNLGSATNNNFNGEATTITASGGGAVGNVSVADTNATFAPLTLPGTLTSLVLSDPNAPITLAAQTLTGVGVGTNLAGETTTLDVTADGAITQSGALAVAGTTSLNADANGGTNAITLSNTANVFSGNVAFTGTSVTLASSGALSSTGTAGGDLSETVGGTISEGAAGIRLTGAPGTDAATFTITGATHDVNLGNAANNFNGEATTIAAGGGGTVGNVSVADTNATFVPLTLPGTLTSLVLSDPNAPITLVAQTLTGVGAGTNLEGGTTTLDVTAGGSITQSGALVVNGTSALNANGGAADITLGNTANAFDGGVTLRGDNVVVVNTAGTTIAGASAASNLTLDAGGAVAFGTVSTASTVVTNGLIVQGLSGSGPTGGPVSQVGKLVVGGSTSIDAGTNDVMLSNSANALTGPVTLTGGAVTLANADATTLAGTNSDGSLTLDAGGAVAFGLVSTDSTTVTNGLIVQGVGGSGAASGAVTQVGTLSVGSASNIDAGGNAITLGNSGNSFGGNVAFAGSAVTLASADSLSSSGTTSGNLSETAGGTIGEGAAGIQLTGTAGTNTATFTVTGSDNVDLGSVVNNFNGEATTITASGGGAVGNVSVADASTTFVPLTLPGTLTSLVLSDPNAPITLAAQTLTGVGAGTNLAGGTTTLAVTAGGPITQSGALTVSGKSALNTGGNITLSNAANAFNGGITLGGNNVTVVSTTGTTIAGASTAGSLTLDSGGAVGQDGNLVVGGTTSIDAGTNAIALSNSANALTGPVTLTGGTVTLANSDATTLAGANSVSSLTLDAGGPVSETGTLSVATMASINAGTNDITLAQANSFGGNVAFSGHNVTLATGTGALMSSGTASGNLTETSAGAITQGGALNVTGKSTLTANAGTGDITLANAGNTFVGPVTLNGGAVTLANTDPTTLGGTNKTADLTLDAGGAVTFGAASTDDTTVTSDLVVQGLSGSGAAGGGVSEAGTLNVGSTTSIDAGANDINLNQVNTFGGDVTFAGHNVTLTAGAGGLTSSGTASGNLTEIAEGSSSDLNVGDLSGGGDVLLIAGDSILGTSSQATVTANNVEVRYGLENSNAQLGSINADQQVGFAAASGSSRVQLTLWLPAPGTQFESQDIRQTSSDLLITRHPFAAGEQDILYSAPFGVSPGQVTGTLAAIQSTLQGTTTQSAGVAQSAATQGTQSVLYIDWGSYNPNVSLFGTLNPAVCLPADQRDEGVGSGSGCAAASASVLKTPRPFLVAMVPTREGWKPMQLFYLAQ